MGDGELVRSLSQTEVINPTCRVRDTTKNPPVSRTKNLLIANS
jgi:hypothetical protein